MKHLVVFLTVVMAGCSWPLMPNEIPSASEVAKAQAVVADFADLEYLTPFFDEAVAYAVYPGALRASAGIGAGYGTGWLLVDGEIVGRTSLYQLSLGASLGGQWYRQILFFRTEDALRRWQRGTFEFAGDAGLAVGTWDAPPSFNTEVALLIELRGGLLVEASVGAHRYDYVPIGKFD